jgi:hypothetical protein
LNFLSKFSIHQKLKKAAPNFGAALYLRNLYKFYFVPFTAKLSTSQVVDAPDTEVYLKATTISFPLKELTSTFPEFTNPAKYPGIMGFPVPEALKGF